MTQDEATKPADGPPLRRACMPAAPESTVGQAGGMPLIEVTYDGAVGEEVLRRLGELLPDVVGEAVECPEEPSTGPGGAW